MHCFTRAVSRLSGLLLAVFFTAVFAQVPAEIADKIKAAGRVLDPRGTAGWYAPLHRPEPYQGVRVTRDVAYGPAGAEKLDLFVSEQPGSSARPVLVFVHGGGFQYDDKRRGASPFYDNVMLWAVREGFIGVNINYRNGPQNPWPAASEDIGLALRWVQQEIAARGGDPKQVFLMGHSAGAGLAASYLSQPRFYGPAGIGLAGAILASGNPYDLATVVDPTFQIYYGTDASRYPERSPMPGLLKSPTPLLLIYAEYDMADEEHQALGLRDALCSAGRCPALQRIAGHNHMSEIYSINTADESAARVILDFMRSKR